MKRIVFTGFSIFAFAVSGAMAEVSFTTPTYVDAAVANMVDTRATATQNLQGDYTVSGKLSVSAPMNVSGAVVATGNIAVSGVMTVPTPALPEGLAD